MPDAAFLAVLSGWRRRDEVGAPTFDADERARLDAVRRAVDPARATVAYATWENPFARVGGLFAVADRFTARLAGRRPVLALSPLHRALASAPDEVAAPVLARTTVRFDGVDVALTLREHRRGAVRWILLDADGFFDAPGGTDRSNPYDHTDPDRLRRDALFAARATPAALAALGLTRDVVVHAQDWEFALAALTVKQAVLSGELATAAVVLSCHNPYDQSWPEPERARLTEREFATVDGAPAHTILQCAIPLLDGPVMTVSRDFADELRDDPLIAGVFADHLVARLREYGVVGVDNGPFVDVEPPFPREVVDAALAGDPAPILARKAHARRTMLAALDGFAPPGTLGALDAGAGRPLVELDDATPVFFMFGRLDPAQKGFDVLARAYERLPRGAARLVLTPAAPSLAPAHLAALGALGERRPGEVVVYPFRMTRGFGETMAGASFVVMPSLYEPFGAATEPALAGTPVIARATGGLRAQVIDTDADPRRGWGVLFRERADVAGASPEATAAAWRELLSHPSPQARAEHPVFEALVDATHAALTRGLELHARPERYAHLLAAAFEAIGRFSWDRAVEETEAVYALACAD